MSQELLVMDGLNKRFLGSKGNESIVALQDVCLTISEGEYVCILGQSGCGKSTLLGVVAGLIAPDSGRITCRGEPIFAPDRHRMLMFQDAALFPWLNVLDNVLYGLSFVEDLKKAGKRERAEKYLEMVGLSDFRHLRIHELSGGMRQRTALARALAPDPDILLMDEPFSALDAMTRESLYLDMQRIWEQTRKTVLMVTHNVREAVCLGSRVLVMKSPGRITTDESVNLPRPRSMNDMSLASTAAHISSLLHNGTGTGAPPS